MEISNQVSLIPSLSIRSLLKTKEQKQKAKCLDAVQNSAIVNFLQIADIDADTVNVVIDDILSIRDDQKILLTAILLNRWFYSKENDVFIKHIPSKTKNVLYQVIVGGSVWDGIYEFSLKGIDVAASGYKDKDGNKVLEIKSPGNYDVLEIDDGDEDGTSITRFEMGDTFEKTILERNYVTIEELKDFTSKDKLKREFLKKKVPNIKIV